MLPDDKIMPTLWISVNRFCLHYHGDCLLWEMKIYLWYFSSLFCLLFYNIYFRLLHAEKK